MLPGERHTYALPGPTLRGRDACPQVGCMPRGGMHAPGRALRGRGRQRELGPAGGARSPGSGFPEEGEKARSLESEATRQRGGATSGC